MHVDMLGSCPPQVIAEVLTDCGSDIDAAIKRLGQLQLRAEGKADAAPAEQSNGAAAAATAASPRPSPQGAMHVFSKHCTACQSLCTRRE